MKRPVRPRGACPVCGRDVGTTRGGVKAAYHYPLDRDEWPPCEGTGQPIVTQSP